MAACTQDAGIRKCRFDARVFGMFGLRTMTGFAVDASMPASGFHRENIAMAGFAGLMAGVDYGQRGHFGNGSTAIVSVLTEALGHEPSPKTKNDGGAEKKERGDADKVLSVLKSIHD